MAKVIKNNNFMDCQSKNKLNFTKSMTDRKKNVKESFASVVKSLLGNTKFVDYRHLVEILRGYFRLLRCSICRMINFINSHLVGAPPPLSTSAWPSA